MTQDLKQPPPIGSYNPCNFTDESDVEIFEDVLSKSGSSNKTNKTDDERQFLTRGFTDAEQVEEQEQENKPPPLMPYDTRVKGRLLEKPPPLESILNYYDKTLLVRGIVASIVAPGGAGKTYFMLQTAYHMAAGSNLGPLQPPKPLKVLLITAEDPQTEVDRRLWAIGKGQFSENLHAVSVTGDSGPLMELKDGNPIRSKWYLWLEETIQAHQGLNVLMLDPCIRFYGLDENSNSHAEQWIACLESLAVKNKVSIIFSHHTNKASSNDEELHQNMNRGASSLIDSCRFSLGLRRMPKKTAKKHGIKDYRSYIEMDVTKTNLAAKLSEPLYFKQDDEGVFSHAELNKDRLEEMAKHLVKILQEDEGEYTSGDLTRGGSKGKPIVDKMKSKFNGFAMSNDMSPVIKYALEKSWLSKKSESGNPGKAKEILKVIAFGLNR